MTPADARKPGNQITVGSHLELHRIHKRKYPNINVGDWVKMVKILKKKKHFDKEHISTWTATIHKVLEIVESLGQKLYKVSNHDKLLVRSDILLVDD